MATLQEKQDKYAVLLHSVDLINQIDSDAPDFSNYGDSNTAAQIVTANKDHLVATKADSAYWDSAPSYSPGWDSVNSAVSTATSFLVTHPYTPEPEDSVAPEGSIDYLKQQATILDQLVTLVSNIDSDAPDFSNYGDSASVSSIVTAAKDHISQILAKADSAGWTWGDSFTPANWTGTETTATSFLTTHPVPPADSEAPEGSLDWWTNRKATLLHSITAILSAADSDIGFSDSDRISIFTANRDHMVAELDRADSYAVYSLSVDSVKGGINNAKGQILEYRDQLNSGFLTRQWSAYFGDSGLGNLNDSLYDAGFRTQTPASTYVTTVMDFNETASEQSRELRGWFLSPYTGDITFYLSTDDMGYMWVGDEVLYDSSMSNANLSNPGNHAAIEDSYTLSMVEGTYYPIRIRYGNISSGPAELQGYYEHSGQAKTNDWSGKIFHNTDSSNGGF